MGDNDWVQNIDCSSIMFTTITANNDSNPFRNTSTCLDHILSQAEDKANPLWILLDNQSTVDVFSNKKILTDIQKIPTSLKIFSTGGLATTNHIGYIPGYGWVWYHDKGIANILSLSRVKRKFRITYESGDDNMFKVHLANGRIRNFVESARGLYYSDYSKSKEETTVLVN